MFLWRKLAEHDWVKANENLLQAKASGQLVIVRRPGRKRLEVEVACARRRDSSALVKKFGGHIEALPRNWLKQFARADSKPIKIGKRLMVSSEGPWCHNYRGTRAARTLSFQLRWHLELASTL
jgi:hypothetical protein